MNPISSELHRQHVAAVNAKRRAELVAKAAQLFFGVGPCELYRAEFDDNGLKLLRVHADGSFRVVCSATGRVLAEGLFPELTAQAATSGISNT